MDDFIVIYASLCQATSVIQSPLLLPNLSNTSVLWRWSNLIQWSLLKQSWTDSMHLLLHLPTITANWETTWCNMWSIQILGFWRGGLLSFLATKIQVIGVRPLYLMQFSTSRKLKQQKRMMGCVRASSDTAVRTQTDDAMFQFLKAYCGSWIFAVSYHAHKKKHSDPSKGKLEWLFTFGDALDGNILGTHAIPALHLPFDMEILPIQSENDNHNCGFGDTAAMAMILRDLALDDSRSTFDDLFSSTALQPKTCATNGDVFCYMPRIDFRPLSALPKFKRDTYLHQLQEQWFVKFDCLAKLQYDDEPKKLFPDFHDSDIFTSDLALISEWPVGNQALFSK